MHARLYVQVPVCKEMTEEKFPTFNKYSDKAPSDKFAFHEVNLILSTERLSNQSKLFRIDQRIKGYLYCQQVVPISSAAKFKPEKRVSLILWVSFLVCNFASSLACLWTRTLMRSAYYLCWQSNSFPAYTFCPVFLYFRLCFRLDWGLTWKTLKPFRIPLRCRIFLVAFTNPHCRC